MIRRLLCVTQLPPRLGVISKSALAFLVVLAISAPLAAQVRSVPPGESDLTLKAMRDELERSRERLRISLLERPFYIEYRLVDVDVRAVTASFGALVSSNTSRNRLMSVDVRVGDHMLDSSNFIGDTFQGFIGNSGQVGIDRDYDSLRQDLWLATDQAYKSALDTVSQKRAYIQSRARPSNIPDFARAEPVVLIEPRTEPDWTNRDWEAEARATSSEFRAFPELHGSRVTYYLLYITQYLMTSEGTQVRTTRSVAAIEAGADAQAADGMGIHNFYSAYALRPADLPGPDAVRKEIQRVGLELMALYNSPPAEDYIGPVLFEAPAAGALLAQLIAPSVTGARPPVSMQPFFEQMMERLGGRSEWSGRIGTRVLPATVSLVDDPTMKEYQGQPLLGAYAVDEEGVRARRVEIVESGMLRGLLMSRRPGPDFQSSNGHGRATFLLSEPRPAMSNLVFQSAETQPRDALREEFRKLCKDEGRTWCLVVRRMDNPVLALTRRQDAGEYFAALAAGATSGDRLPLLVYKVNVEDGREELVRGAWLAGLQLRALRSIAGVGDDYTVTHVFQDPQALGTALATFSSAQGGLPSSIVAPSLLLGEVELRGARGQPRRPPIVPPPPMKAGAVTQRQRLW
ncbi:MAG: metallopeptidase TldD-related protein [Candidatus Acidiferrales bacterium]